MEGREREPTPTGLHHDKGGPDRIGSAAVRRDAGMHGEPRARDEQDGLPAAQQLHQVLHHSLRAAAPPSMLSLSLSRFFSKPKRMLCGQKNKFFGQGLKCV